MAIEGMESCDDFFQLTKANVTQSKLQAIASATDTYPTGRKTSNVAGMKMKATVSRATIVVYPVPVDFWESNIAISSVVGVA
jgi:hypothetical protein